MGSVLPDPWRTDCRGQAKALVASPSLGNEKQNSRAAAIHQVNVMMTVHVSQAGTLAACIGPPCVCPPDRLQLLCIYKIF